MHRPHRHLHREGGEEGEPQAPLHVGRELVRHQRGDVGGARLPVHRHHGEQHQHRAEQRVEEELEACVDAVGAAPDADDQEHRDEAALEEDVEQHQVERAEDADHQRLEHQEGDHVLLDAVLDHTQLDSMHKRQQERRQHDEQHRDAVDAQLVLEHASQARCSTNWKSAVAVSKLNQIRSESANVMIVVHSATQRALSFASGLRQAMISAPTSGRNMTIDRIGAVARSI